MSTLYTFNKQQFNADVSFNSNTTFNNTSTQISSSGVVGISGGIVNISGGVINLSSYTFPVLYASGDTKLTSRSGFTTFINNDKTSGDVRINTGSSGSNVIVENGNVGIGTATPAYTLDVSGNANVSGSFNSLMYITTKSFSFNPRPVSPNPNNSKSTSQFIGKIFNGGLITVYIKSSGYDHGEGTIAEIFCGYGSHPVVRVVSGFQSTYSFYSIVEYGTTYIWFNEYSFSGYQNVDYECRIYCNNPSNFYPTTTDGYGPSSATEITNGQFILGNGNVGIGTTNPRFPLEIPNRARPFYPKLQYFSYDTTTITYSATAGGVPIQTLNDSSYGSGVGWSICCNGILASEFGAFSDSRIKNNIVDIDDEQALHTLRLIKPKTYDYVDKIHKGNANVIGFIAQEIKEIIPKAVTIFKDYVPNFMTLCQITPTDASNIVLVTSPIDLSWNPLHGSANASDPSGNAFMDAAGNACSDASGNKCFNVKLYDQSNNEIKCKTTAILDKRSFLMDTKIIKDGEYFLYGQEIDDFHALDKNAIFTVVTAAVQDIDRKQVLDEAKIAALEQQVASLQTQVASLQSDTAKIAALESQIASFEARLAALEAK